MSNTESDKPGIAEMRDQIDQTREELAHTVEALAAKADVKSRAQDKVADVSARAKLAADHGRATAREKTQVALDKVPPSVREKSQTALDKVPPSVRARSTRIGIGAGAAAVLMLGWFVRRRRRS